MKKRLKAIIRYAAMAAFGLGILFIMGTIGLADTCEIAFSPMVLRLVCGIAICFAGIVMVVLTEES